MSNNLKINKTDEDFIKNIIVIQEEKGQVRQRDLVARMGKGESNIRAALIRLTEKELVVPRNTRGGAIKLTNLGKKLAREIVEKHHMIQGWLIHMGVDKDMAMIEACELEHAISKETLKLMEHHAKTPAENREKEGASHLIDQLGGPLKAQKIIDLFNQVGGVDMALDLVEQGFRFQKHFQEKEETK